MNQKKYLDDRAIENANDDKFGHVNIASQIAEIISEQSSESPVNIGLFGKWGVGKSSVIELLEKEILKTDIENSDLKFVRVNVWKYQTPTSIRNKIFYQIAMQLDVEDKVKKIYENSTTTTNNLNYKSFLGRFLTKKFYVDQQETVFSSAIMFIVGVFILYFLYNQNPKIGFLANILASFIGSVGVLKLGMDYFFKSIVTSTTIQSKPFESEEQFEHEIIELFNKDEFKSVKKILFIDDLDRCSSDKVLNTLETIKTFLQINNCIFIVACDHDLIKKAVIDSNKEFNYKDKDGANYLEKFFQHFIYLPPYLPANLRDYTKNLILDAKLSIETDLGVKLDTIIYILAYRDIINPRKIKVLLNSFIFEYYSIREKEKDEKHVLQDGLITGSPERIAILTVLKVDFPLFVNDLIVDPTLCSKIAYNSSDIDNEKLKERYFTDKSDCEKEYLDLIRSYLFLVKDWIPRDFTPYLYVSVESAYFQKFKTVRSNQLLRLIRNGDEAILKDIKEMGGEERVNIFCAIGNLQESLSNSIERRNATIIMTLLVMEFPEAISTLSTSNILYSFKSNLELLFEQSDDYEKINGHGLRNIIVACYDSGFYEQGKGILKLSEKQEKSSSGFLFFLLGFLNDQCFPKINSPTLIDDLKINLSSQLHKTVDQLNYISIVPDIMGIVSNSLVFENYLSSLTPQLAKFCLGDFRTLDKDTRVEGYDPFFFISHLTKMQDLGLGMATIEFLAYIFKREKSLYSLLVNKLENIIKRDSEVVNFVLKNEPDASYWTGDLLYLMTLLRFSCASTTIEENGRILVNPSILGPLSSYLTYLETENNELLSKELILLHSTVLKSQKLDMEEKISYLLQVLQAYSPTSKLSDHLSYVLSQSVNFSNPQLIRKHVTANFKSLVEVGPDIEMLEAFVTNYSSLLILDLIDPSIVESIFMLHTTQLVPNLTKFLYSVISQLPGPLELDYLITKVAKETSTENVTFAVELLLADTTFSKLTISKLNTELPTLFSKTYIKTTDRKSYYSYVTPLRAKMLEILLINTTYDYSGDIFKFMGNSSFNIINSFSTAKGLSKLLERLCRENPPKSTSLKQQLLILPRMRRIVERVGGPSANTFFDYIISVLSFIHEANSSQKKSQINKVFQEIQTGFTKYPYEVSSNAKKSFQLLAKLATLINPNAKGRVSKLAKTFGIPFK